MTAASSQRRSRNVLLSGFYGRSNCGDDALLAVSAWAAREFLGARTVNATADRSLKHIDAGVRSLYYDVRWRGVHRLNQLRESWCLRRTDAVMFGGGSVFHRRDDLDRWSAWLSRIRGGPSLAVGVSVGPFKKTSDERACARLLNQLHFVGVRDSVSLQRARALTSATPVELTFDIAPLLFSHVAPPSSTSPEQVPHDRYLAMSLCPSLENPGDATWLGRLAEAICRASRDGLLDRVVLLDLNADPHLAAASDGQIHAELRALIAGRVPTVHRPYLGDPWLTAAWMKSAAAVVAMRLHAAVFAYSLGVPTIIAPYHEKCVEWSKTIGQPPELTLGIDSWAESELSAALRMALRSDSPRPRLPLSTARRRALSNWSRPGD